jgi:hypothetical protein
VHDEDVRGFAMHFALLCAELPSTPQSLALLGLFISGALNRVRLRPGFDLFSHSSHNLIKRATLLHSF